LSGEEKRMAEHMEIDQARLVRFCEKHRIRKLSLFGSVLRDDFGPDSDVDVLVEFEPDSVPSYFKLFDMEEELTDLLGGRRADLQTPAGLSRYFRSEVIRSAEVQYAAG